MEKQIRGKIGESMELLQKADTAGLVETIPNDVPVIIPERILERTKKHIISFYDQKGKIPAKAWLQKKLNMSGAKVTDIIKALVTEDFLYKKGNRYYLKSANPDEFRIPSIVDKAKAAAKLSPAMVFVKTILFIIGCGAVYMSIFHSKDFLSEFYTPTRSIIAATIMIVFNVLAAEMAIFFWIKRHRALTVAFLIILVLGTVFSMGSTIIGLYNARANDLTISYTEENTDTRDLQEIQKEYESILDRKVQAEADLNSERAKRDGVVNTINQYTPEMINADLENYNKMNGRRYIADTRVDKAKIAYSAVVAEEKEFLELNTVTAADTKEIPGDAYTWIGGTVFPTVRPDTLQFWMSTYPALFYDIIAPAAFSIVFFVTGAKKKKERKHRKRRRHAKR